DALRNGRVDREVALALGGWTSPSGFAAVGDSYGNGFDPSVLVDEIKKVRYPGLDLLNLKRKAERSGASLTPLCDSPSYLQECDRNGLGHDRR
ncbi:MAG: hypothetical protein ACXWIW_12095, partial [Croceibacterium sp.]